MIEYADALQKILQSVKPPQPAKIPLRECLGRVLARDLKARISLPSFDNSAVDGYAVASGTGGDELQVCGEIRAGSVPSKSLRAAEAMRVFTGAPLPRGARAVVMQENTVRTNGRARILKAPRDFENIRRRGEDVRKGDCILRRGSVLEPQHLALLAAQGFAGSLVFPAPTVSLVTTGSELVAPGSRLRSGKIYDSNTALVRAMLQKMGAQMVSARLVADEPSRIRRAVRRGLESDFLLLSGGVSVGKYDGVKEALAKEGVEVLFWKVNIKPGKPLFFGRRGGTHVFGLPGNPVSVFVTFEAFVKPALLKFQGKGYAPRSCEGVLSEDFENGARRHFVRVLLEKNGHGHRITLLKKQGSHQLSGLARANALLVLEARQSLKKGQRVTVQLLEAGP